MSRLVEGSKRDAQKVANELSVEADKGRLKGTGATFQQLAEQWLSLAKDDLSPTTVHRYEILLRKHIYPAIGDVSVKNIETLDLDRLYNGLSKQSRLAPATVRQVHAIIRRAFKQAMTWGWVSMNPAAVATLPRRVKPDLAPPDVGEVDELLQAATELDPEFGHFLHLSATTGARRGEMCALRWRNVDEEKGTLSIERSIIELSGGGILEKDTKTHASRRIALDEHTLLVLESQRALIEERATFFGVEVIEDAFIFSREPDGSAPWTPDSATRSFMKIRDELGFDNIRLHDMRHFAATRLIAGGVPIRTVSGRLGHANPATTLSVYSHFVEASDQDAAKLMGGLVGGGRAAVSKSSSQKKQSKRLRSTRRS
jgi:integrase